ncbi:MAG TPA: flagellar hook-associated protein FlgK [Jatrophihabitans sp.]|jgi:flagellar hook-associated protein 1 FlgK|nr:flagellar hook-associated protein FlgK [Jatrophihabitans sp.]
MASTFGEITQASTALTAARYGLDVVSQNIANSDTPGYTRQVAQQGTVDAVPGVPSIYTAAAGVGGVRITGTARLADAVVDARLRTEQARDGLASTTSSQLQQIETVFPEPSDTGLSERLNDFWKAWAPVANDPKADAARIVLLQDAGTVTNTLNAMSATLSNQATASAQILNQDAAAATSAATQLATVNAQIAVASATGLNENSLLDKRDSLLSTLAGLLGGSATINPNGTADVTVAGQPLVTGGSAVNVTVDPGYTLAVGGTSVTLTGGSLAAESTALSTTYPAYQARLDAVANALSSVVNGVQAGGYDLSGTPGTPMFSGSTAATISVSITDPKLVAASSTAGGTLDGSNALSASVLGATSTGPDAAYAALVADIASASSLAQRQAETQSAVTSSVSALQTSISGVSTDEEVSAMMTYQRAYQAASRVMTTVDDMLDTLINHTGVVGRA